MSTGDFKGVLGEIQGTMAMFRETHGVFSHAIQQGKGPAHIAVAGKLTAAGGPINSGKDVRENFQASIMDMAQGTQLLNQNGILIEGAEDSLYEKEYGGSDVEVNSVDDLAKYSVLKVRGVKHTNTITKELTNVYNYDNTEAMLRALDKGRNNVAITHRADGDFAIKKHGLKDIDSSEYPMFSFPLYHYVFKEKRHLVDKINRIFVDMKASGELDILIRKAEKQVFEANGLVYQPPE